MKAGFSLGVVAGVAVLSLVVGVVIGWKIHGVRLSFLKRRRQYHSLKAHEIQQQLNH